MGLVSLHICDVQWQVRLELPRFEFGVGCDNSVFSTGQAWPGGQGPCGPETAWGGPGHPAAWPE